MELIEGTINSILSGHLMEPEPTNQPIIDNGLNLEDITPPNSRIGTSGSEDRPVLIPESGFFMSILELDYPAKTAPDDKNNQENEPPKLKSDMEITKDKDDS